MSGEDGRFQVVNDGATNGYPFKVIDRVGADRVAHYQTEYLARSKADELNDREVRRNLASLNELVAQLANVATDAEFAEMARTVLRNHTWNLNFEFEGERPRPAS